MMLDVLLKIKDEMMAFQRSCRWVCLLQLCGCMSSSDVVAAWSGVVYVQVALV
jgi:hypothetical protein